jgi:hypothetical protein
MQNPAVDILRQAQALLERAAEQPVRDADDATLCAIAEAVESVGRLIDGLRATTAAEIDERSRFELGRDGLAYRLGHRRAVHLLEDLTRTSQADAAARVRLGRSIRAGAGLDGRALPARFPHVAAAVRSGSIAIESARVVVQCLSQAARHNADPELIDDAEQALVAEARRESSDCVAVMARAWRDALDPDGTAPREEALRDRRSFVLGRERNGMTPFWGAADPVAAAQLKAAFAESTAPDAAPRFLSEEDTLLGTTSISTLDGDIVQRVSDPRTREQRQFDVMFGLLTAGMRSNGQRPTATVMAVISLENLESGAGLGWLDDVAEPVSAQTIRELVCDAGFRRLLLGPDGEPLAEGRMERLFTQAQRRALGVRDGGCVWPQCTAPPSWCDAHHVEEWAKGGLTDVDNGALLCSAHHHMLHNSDFTMKMIDGRPHLLAPPWLDPARAWRKVGSARVLPSVRFERAA